jgi:Holliday junction resolvase
MKINSINKGKTFEREIANFLTKAIGVKFHRVPMSGAFSTNNNSNDSRFDGDVFTEDKEYKDIVIECKSYSDLQLNDLYNDKSKFFKWIEQAESEAKGKDWILFIKINHKGTYMISSRMDKLSLRLIYGNNKPIMVRKKLLFKIK